MDDAIGLAGVGIVFSGLALLCWKVGVITAGGVYIERERQPRLFAIAASVPVICAFAGFLGAVACLFRA